MGNLSKEFENVQNPALGAYIIWNFSRGYYEYNSSFIPFQLFFVVLPIIFRADLVDIITSTQKQSGLRYFADKFLTTKVLKNDMVSHIHKASEGTKLLTLKSLQIAIHANLISLDAESALLFPITISEKKSESASVIRLGKAAEKLGNWCARLTMHEISQILKVRF
ncbi:DUF6521 family protein [Dehalobacter sp. DCM]|jgi:hypothetical protein|uniref:three component ABC system middle component n=1 Tax=Dehalobacter sp. DCM TaxID=2907827 RepID=UPI0030817D57|nr:DUF6521 family protein [Dehalobacter sp. DCM]